MIKNVALSHRRGSILFKLVIAIVLVSFAVSSLTRFFPQQEVEASIITRLPEPATLMQASQAFNPVSLAGIRIYPDNPFKFEFIVDEGDSKLTNKQLQKEASRLINYFLAGLTIPASDLWVNLSPYEKEIIIPEELGLTEMGRDMLGEDYILKQLVSSLTYPESPLGERFWQKVYEKAYQLYGTTDIPLNTFNKVMTYQKIPYISHRHIIN